jgi:hypothetical protein
MALLAICWLDECSGLTINLLPGANEVYAVRNKDHECLNVHGEFEHEPSPSNRSNEFLARCRWKSFDEAVQAVERYKQLEVYGILNT